MGKIRDQFGFNWLNERGRYKKRSKGALVAGEDDIYVSYKRNKRVETHIVSATWTHVLIVAFLNALAVSAFKWGYYSTFGKPDIFAGPESSNELVIGGDVRGGWSSL